MTVSGSRAFIQNQAERTVKASQAGGGKVRSGLLEPENAEQKRFPFAKRGAFRGAELFLFSAEKIMKGNADQRGESFMRERWKGLRPCAADLVKTD